MPDPQTYRFPHIRAIVDALFLILRLGVFSCVIGFGKAETVKLAWNPNPEPNIAGYRLHYWEQSGNLRTILNVGKQTSAKVSNLAPSTTYFFALQAYNDQGLISELSSPISYTTKDFWTLEVNSANGARLPKLGSSMNLGSVNLGAISAPSTFTITNNGENTLTNVSFSLDGLAAENFLISGNLPPGTVGKSSGLLIASLAPRKSITLDFVFRPTTDGLHTAVLRITAKETENSLFSATLSASGSGRFDAWLASKALGGGALGNADGDALNHLQEYAFGTDPTAAHGKPVAQSANGLTRGAPTVRISTTPALEMHGMFGRRMDHEVVRLRYLPQFSSDLVNWVDASNPQVAEADDGEIELVAVKSPNIGGKPARFFRVGVAQAGPPTFPEWLAQHRVAGGMNGNPDGDALHNFQEYAFGTHPGAAERRSIGEIGGFIASRGAPNVRVTSTPVFQFRGLYGRRIGHASLGIIYKPQFSADLTNWVDADNPPEKLADDGEIEVISVLAPAMIHGKPARFFRVGVVRKLVRFDDWLATNAISQTSDAAASEAAAGLLEYAFGMDRGIRHSTSIEESAGTLKSRGMPTARVTTTPEFQFRGLFGRRIGHASLGIIYKPQFSADLTNWVDADSPPVKLTDDGEIEVISVLAPAMIHGKPARFFRVGVNHQS